MPITLARTSPLLFVLAAVASTGCGELTVGPLPGGTPVAVTLTRTQGSLVDPPRVSFGAAAGAIDVVWETSGGCELASATAERSGSIVQVTLTRSADPLALCVAMIIGMRYHHRLTGLAPGSYSVRFLAESFGQPVREVGRARVTVGASVP